MRRMTSIDRFSDAGASHTAKSQLQTRPLHLAKLNSDQLYSTVQGGSFCTSSLSSNTVLAKRFCDSPSGVEILDDEYFRTHAFCQIFFICRDLFSGINPSDCKSIKACLFPEEEDKNCREAARKEVESSKSNSKKCQESSSCALCLVPG